MFNWFKKKKPVRIPVAGETWYFREDDSPWASKKSQQVQIIDVKNGWVRYYMNKSFDDNRMKIDSFLFWYRAENDA